MVWCIKRKINKIFFNVFYYIMNAFLDFTKSYISSDGKLKIGIKENFDADLLPINFYNRYTTDLKLSDVDEMKKFVRNLDTPLIDLTVDLLDNRIKVLTVIKEFFNNQVVQYKDIILKEITLGPNITEENFETKVQKKADSQTASGTNIGKKMIEQNFDASIVFINRVIDLIISHSNELRVQKMSGSNIEFFTLTPIILELPEINKLMLNRFMSKYGVSFDDFIEFVRFAELPAKNLNSKNKILRLRVLSTIRKSLELAIGFDVLLKNDLVNRQIPTEMINTQIEVMNLIYSIGTYVIDLHLKELYINMTSDEIKIGNYFEKFIKYYPKDADSIKRELMDNKNRVSELEKRIDEASKSVAAAERKMTEAKSLAESQVAEVKKSVEGKLDNMKTMERDIRDKDQFILEARQNQMMFIGAIGVLILLCIIITVMYIRK